MSVSVPGDQYLGGLFLFFGRAIRKHLLVMTLLSLIVMAVTYFAALQLPTVYTAQGSIRIGRVDGAEAISPIAAVSRINSPSFKQRVIQATTLPAGDGNQPAQLILGNLSARQETAGTVAVSVRATTAQQVRDALAAVVNLLNEEQRRTLGPLETDIKEQLAASETSIASLLETRDLLSSLAREDSKGAHSDPAFAALLRLWLSDLDSRNEHRLAAAKAEQRALSARLGAWKNYPTALLDDAFVSQGFALARPITIAVFAGGVIFLLLVLSALLRESKAVRPG
jgi:hypothetical protein